MIPFSIFHATINLHVSLFSIGTAVWKMWNLVTENTILIPVFVFFLGVEGLYPLYDIGCFLG